MFRDLIVQRNDNVMRYGTSGGGEGLQTCAGRQNVFHPSTAKNFPHPYSPLPSSSLTRIRYAQSFSSPAIIPHIQYTFPQFPAIFFHKNIRLFNLR